MNFSLIWDSCFITKHALAKNLWNFLFSPDAKGLSHVLAHCQTEGESQASAASDTQVCATLESGLTRQEIRKRLANAIERS